MLWSQLLRRIFAVDVLRCPCGAQRKIIGVLSRAQTLSIARQLATLHLPVFRGTVTCSGKSAAAKRPLLIAACEPFLIRCDVLEVRFSRALASWHFASYFWLFFATLGRQFDNLTSTIVGRYPLFCHETAFGSLTVFDFFADPSKGYWTGDGRCSVRP